MPYCVCSYGYLVIHVVALWIQYCGIPVGLSFYYMQFNWDDWFLCKFFVFVSHFSSTDTTELADNTATAVDGIIATLFFIVKNGQSSFEDEYKMVKLHSGQATEYIYFGHHCSFYTFPWKLILFCQAEATLRLLCTHVPQDIYILADARFHSRNTR